ncbi:hydrolase or metal-binding protein, partial [Acinetobacter nosocomialis]
RLRYYHAASGDLLSCLPLQLTLRGKSTTQSYRTPIYYVDLTLRDGINLQEAITSAKQIDGQSKTAGFYQEALDHVARLGYGNARFEVGGEEGLDIVEEFYINEPKPEQGQQLSDLTHVQDIQKGLQHSVQALN